MTENKTPRTDACEVPLVEQLRNVPIDGRQFIVDDEIGSSRNIPYGRMCHEAADAIDIAVGARVMAESELTAALAAKERAENALLSINEIRNSIIGTQTMNWSEHVYPLVEALNGAGFEGMPYDEARGKFGTMLERTRKAESERDALAAKLAEAERLQLKQSTPPIVRYTLDISDGRMVKSPDGFWASADELAAAYTTIATLTSKLAEAESGSRVAAVEEINSMLESVMYPPPPYEVKVQEDYFSGATAYRNSLKAAIDAAIEEESKDEQ